MYKEKKVSCKVSKLEWRAGCAIDFCFDHPPYDEKYQDGIACVACNDPEREIEILRKGGYSDTEIENIYRALCESAQNKLYNWGEYFLPRPIRVTTTVHRWDSSL